MLNRKFEVIKCFDNHKKGEIIETDSSGELLKINKDGSSTITYLYFFDCTKEVLQK